MGYRSLNLRFFVLIFLTLATGCTARGAGLTPGEQAANWYGAVVTLQQTEAEGLVCDQELEQFKGDMARGNVYMSVANFFEGTVVVRLDLSGVSFEVKEERGDWSLVSANGELELTVADEGQRAMVGESWYMKREKGEWRWCGHIEPIAPAAAGPEGEVDGLAGQPVTGREEEAIRRRGLLALKRLETFRYHGEWVPDMGFPDRSSPLEGSVSATQGADTSTSDRGKLFLWIEQDGTRCTSSAGDPWLCEPIGEEATVFDTMVELWRELLTRNDARYRYRYQLDELDSEACHLFSRTGNGWESLCLDAETFFPVRHSRASGDPHLNEKALLYWSVYPTGHNEPVSIKLPSD